MKNKKDCLLIIILIAIMQCSPNPVYRNQQTVQKKTVAKQVTKKKYTRASVSSKSTIAQAKPVLLASAASPENTTEQTVANEWEIDDSTQPTQDIVQAAGTAKQDAIPARQFVRVAIKQNVSSARILSATVLTIKTTGGTDTKTFSGSAVICKDENPAAAVCDIAGQGKLRVALPCTLATTNDLSVVTIDGTSYRGSIVIVPDDKGISIVNMLDVEDYLRGVVALEVGKGNDEIIEAVKAQAVAARTYTYKKMQENGNDSYDLLSTVADQVYGGVNAESETCNQAIRTTVGEVLFYRDSLIYAYYHSTCAGRTANIEDVWNKSPLPYLKSVDDGGSHPYCGLSGSLTWEEQWPLSQFSALVNKYSKEAFPKNPVTGSVKDISINSKFDCGRIKECTIKTTTGSVVYGGDKIRFAIRRNASGNAPLKSCLFTDASIRGSTVIIKGRGYGHGVGMCQMGAIGRAKAGQSYKEILKTYYTGVEIKKLGQ